MQIHARLILFLLVSSSVSLFAAKPNIVLVMADDQGWGDMAYNGHPHVKTPNFDRAAATGLRFDRFYAAAPVCSPTRASVMTGRHPNRMGVFKWGYPMRPQETTIAEALKTAGYATGHFGKWHLGSVRRQSDAHPGVNGFDEFLSAPNFYDNDPILSHNGKAVPIKGESSIVAAEAALEWMKKISRTKQPFLSVVWFGSPHGPHVAVEQDRKLYEGQPKANQHFLGEVTGMDRAFGMIRDGLEKMGIRDNTILWYTSDNGALKKVGSAGPFRGLKGQVYEGGLLVPAILEWPEVIKNHRVIAGRCNSSDIYPTLLEIVGVKVKNQARLDGISLASVIRGGNVSPQRSMGFWDMTKPGIGTPAAAWMKELYEAQQQGKDLPTPAKVPASAKLPDPKYSTDSFPGNAAWIDGDWKLIRKQDKKGKVTLEFYNLAVDKGEQQDILGTEGERVRHYRGRLESWLKSVVGSLNGNDY
ncbi:MAG: N-acetylgalactosamine 6-sulfate sulfatase [Verrucomicrobiales bacterium]|nr:N-acetylgalactosamine 6-sulfate sulfatase [Verrucomicrobiales bacterium]|tara:strand:- start:3785 stop:5200 length:1416 start_codon:yes stop_codon:yes gene_type:complete